MGRKRKRKPKKKKKELEVEEEETISEPPKKKKKVDDIEDVSKTTSSNDSTTKNEDSEIIVSKTKAKKKEKKNFLELLENAQKFDISTKKFAKEKKFSADFFPSYKIKDFSKIERKIILDNVQKKYSIGGKVEKSTQSELGLPHTYIRAKDLKHLEKWRQHLVEEREAIVGSAITSIEVKDMSGKYGRIADLDKKWKEKKKMILCIDKLLIAHEGSTFVSKKGKKGSKARDKARKDEMTKTRGLMERRKSRLAREKIERESSEDEFNKLSYVDERLQLKHFLKGHGPIDGKRKFSEWKESQQLAKVSKNMTDDISGKTADKYALEYDEDLLNDSLL